MAESSKFGAPKGFQFGDATSGNQTGDDGSCAQCEAMLADAIDGLLSPADQELFDRHMAECGPCSHLLADAKRGVAWLEMLRDPQPEPPAELLEKILAQTSGLTDPSVIAHPAEVPAVAGGYVHAGHVAVYTNILPFRQRFMDSLRSIAMQPRLAMTAAMAFFSIALTMNLTGIQLTDLRPTNLRPSVLKRNFYVANARIVQYYEGLRVVYELESRVRDFETVQGEETPAAQPAPQPKPTQQNDQEPDQQNDQKQRPATASPPSGASRRDDSHRPVSLATILIHEVQFATGAEMGSADQTNWEGTLV